MTASVATVRRIEAGDRETMRRFFHELSPESRRLRFFTAGEPADALIDRLCDSADERRNVTLVAVRQTSEATCDSSRSAPISPPASMPPRPPSRSTTGSMAKGLATELLERLAAIAAHHGFRRFDATTLADNHAMIEVFRDSGFEVRSKSARGVMEVTLTLTPSAEGVDLGGNAPAAGDRCVAAPDARTPAPWPSSAHRAVRAASAGAFSMR